MAITSPYWPTGKCGKATIPLSKLSITRGTSPTGCRKYLPPSRPQKYLRRRAFLDGAIPCDDEPSQSRAPDRHRAPDQHRNGEGPSLPRRPQGPAIKGEGIGRRTSGWAALCDVAHGGRVGGGSAQVGGGVASVGAGDTAVTELKSFEELQHPVREPGE